MSIIHTVYVFFSILCNRHGLKNHKTLILIHGSFISRTLNIQANKRMDKSGNDNVPLLATY